MRELIKKENLTHVGLAEKLGLSYYEYTKNRPSRTLKNFRNLIDALNKTKREEARYVLLAYVYKEEVYVEVSYFKSESDALYATRYLKGIAKREYKGFRLSCEPIKKIELV